MVWVNGEPWGIGYIALVWFYWLNRSSSWLEFTSYDAGADKTYQYRLPLAEHADSRPVYGGSQDYSRFCSVRQSLLCHCLHVDLSI